LYIYLYHKEATLLQQKVARCLPSLPVFVLSNFFFPQESLFLTLALFQKILLTATLRHPNIVNFVGACWGRKLTALVLEFVAKGSLGGLLADVATKCTWTEPLLRLLTDVARGMLYLHSREYFDDIDGCFKSCILHRDLKVHHQMN
jgi:serine/threonine protein kinase